MIAAACMHDAKRCRAPGFAKEGRATFSTRALARLGHVSPDIWPVLDGSMIPECMITCRTQVGR